MSIIFVQVCSLWRGFVTAAAAVRTVGACMGHWRLGRVNILHHCVAPQVLVTPHAPCRSTPICQYLNNMLLPYNLYYINYIAITSLIMKGLKTNIGQRNMYYMTSARSRSRWLPRHIKEHQSNIYTVP